ncbi:MAG: DUF475 domain-containing protein [Zoogloeaceae bacterium]|jgi:hypothetical protein|nr:DUF475 domain-containing protein [Zoogloeaceae bacterium]
MKDFRFSFLVTFVCLLLAGYWGVRSGMGLFSALVLTAALGVMEVSLSFDNAVVNASILKDMSERWQRIFLTLGILVAVFGMRLFFPIAIVAVATGLGMVEVSAMALAQPEAYARHLAANHASIASFGGMFLLLVFLTFLFDAERELFWLGRIEARLARLGELKTMSVLLALLALLGVYLWMPLPPPARLSVLSAGVSGVAAFMLVNSLDHFFASAAKDEKAANMSNTVNVAKRNGVAGFLYLEALDASFSFDGVIGAFAITRDVVVIMLGLGIGAMFVRSLTVHLVRRGTLDEYVFLEHGAHYAIGALAVIMLAGIVWRVPEILTGLVGVAFIALALISSIRYKKSGKTEGIMNVPPRKPGI